MNARWLLRQTAWVLPLVFSACIDESNVAGSSSGVDNPQIEVAFTTTSGTASIATTATGTLSVYLANQNPALSPNPIFQLTLDKDSSVTLSAQEFIPTDSGSDSAQTYNVLLIGSDSSGGLLQSITYDPKTHKFSRSGGASVLKDSLKLAPLVNYSWSLASQNDTNPVRIFIPGTPFQATVVDSAFTFSQIPPGVFPLHLITGGGVELPLPDSLNTSTHPAQPFPVDSSAPPVSRGTAPPPPALQVNAGPDQTVFLGTQTFLLSGKVTGVSPSDPQLAIVWRQISPSPSGVRAVIANATALTTSVSFPKPGAYSFVLSATFGTNPPKQDTVFIGVQPPPPAAFIAPDSGDTVLLGKSFRVAWNGRKVEKLALQFALNGGTWTPVSNASAIPADTGFNAILWTPPGSVSSKCQLRLLGTGDTLTSATFTLSP